MLSLLMPSRGASVNWAPWDQRWYTAIAPRTAAGPMVSEETALKYSAVWAATRIISTTFARLKLMPWERTGDRGGQWLRDTPESRALNYFVNPDSGAYSFRSFMMACQLNHGNGFAEIVRSGGVVNLYPIHPSRVVMAEDRGKRALYRVLGNSEASTVDLNPEEILHVPSCMVDERGWGKGVIQFARENFGTSLAAERNRANQFGANNVPPIVVETPKMMNPDDRVSFRKEWREVHSEGGAAVALLTGGATAKALNLNYRDMQHLELSYFGIEDVSRWYGVPLHMLAHLLKSSQNNIEELSNEFIDYCLSPWVEPWKQELNLKLLNRADVGRIEWEIDDRALRRGSRQARAAYYQSAITLGYMTRNEVREEEGFNPLDGGDEPMVQGAMIPASDAGREPAQPATQQQNNTTAEAWLRDVCGRMIRVETNAIRRAAESPDKIVDTVEKFYAKHAATMTDAISGAMIAMNRSDAGALASEWCRKSNADVLKILRAATAANVASLIATWADGLNAEVLVTAIQQGAEQ